MPFRVLTPCQALPLALSVLFALPAAHAATPCRAGAGAALRLDVVGSTASVDLRFSPSQVGNHTAQLSLLYDEHRREERAEVLARAHQFEAKHVRGKTPRHLHLRVTVTNRDAPPTEAPLQLNIDGGIHVATGSGWATLALAGFRAPPGPYTVQVENLQAEPDFAGQPTCFDVGYRWK